MGRKFTAADAVAMILMGTLLVGIGFSVMQLPSAATVTVPQADDAIGKAIIQTDGATISHAWGDENWLEVWRLTGDGDSLVLEAPDGEQWNLTEITRGKATPKAFGLEGGSDD